MADHLGAAHASKGSQCRNQINRFEDVGLALRIVTEQHMESGRKAGVQPLVIAEVTESELRQMHRGKDAKRTGDSRDFFSDQH